MKVPFDRRYVPAVLGMLVGGVVFSSVNISCGAVNDACAADCQGVADLEAKVATMETTITKLQTRIDELTGNLTQAMSIEQLACTPGQVMEWNGTGWVCAGPKQWIARFARIDATTIQYELPGGVTKTITITDPAVAVTGTHIAYRPGGSGDATLYFFLEGAPSTACTLLHDEDDALRPGHYFATDGGNNNAAIWGNSTTPTFMFARAGLANYGLATNESHAIACLN
jgi:hypothetical protein